MISFLIKTWHKSLKDLSSYKTWKQKHKNFIFADISENSNVSLEQSQRYLYTYLPMVLGKIFFL